MFCTYTPSTVVPPDSTWSHAVEIRAGARTIHVSGQTGHRPDGSLADGIEAQSEWAWKNLADVLRAAGMSLENLVTTTIYLTSPDFIEPFRAVRAQALGHLRPAATLVVISALAGPGWLVEIAAVAAE